jgi:membrane complex biogenesis BtpA family protein
VEERPVSAAGLPPRELVGMIHVGATPGSPRASERIEALCERAVAEARAYRDAGFTALMIENMHDRPYLKGAVPPETVAAMTAVGREVRRAVALPLGVQVLAAANRESLAVALACDAAFVRVEGFVFAHVADEGVIDGCAGELMRARAALGAEHIRVLADIKKKHASHAITADVDLGETARAAAFALADGVIVTGVATGRAADPDEVRVAKEAVEIPVWVGSGISPDTLARYPMADGYIVGSAAKRDGHWEQPLDADATRALADAFRSLPESRR